MSSSRLIIFGVAGAAAIGAGYLAKNLTTQPPQQVVASAVQERPSLQLTEVLVVRDPIDIGTKVDGKLRWQSWPVDAVGEGFVTRDAEPNAIEELAGTSARTSMLPGEPLRKTRLIGAGQRFMSSILPSGKRAIATQIAADTSAGGFILPDDYVDVIMTRRSEMAGERSYITETILKNVRVLAIDQAIQVDEQGRPTKVGETATLELTPQQSEIITVAQQMADRLTLALRPMADAAEAVTESADYLVSGSGRRGTVRLIRSGEMSEVGARK